MRVLAVSLRYPPYVAGGYELLTRDAVEALRARGHDVTVLAGNGARLAGEPDVLPWLQPGLDGSEDLFGLSHAGSNAERFRLHVLRLANVRATRRALRETGAQVLFYFNLGLVSLAPIVAARLAGVPTLGYASDPWPANHWLRDWRADPLQRSKRARLALLERFWRGFRGLVDMGELLTCSEYLRDLLVARGLDAETTRVVHLGVPPDVERLVRPDAPVRDAGRPLHVLCLSSFWEGKGQDVLLEAASRANAAGARIDVLLAGTGMGAFRAALEARALEPDLAGRVSFAEPLDREGVSRALAASHVLVLPSLWGEPFALATLEGMAHGLAVVVSDAGGSPEALTDGVEGVVFAAGDVEELAHVLHRLDADEPMRRRLGAAARARARQDLSHARFVDRLEEALVRVRGPLDGGAP